MNKKRMTGVVSAAICAALLILSALPASANSALTKWEGASSVGVVTADGNCPVTVEKETLTFEIDSSFEDITSRLYELFSDPDQVTAAYTLYNPADYAVKARLFFPFGGTPSYGSEFDMDPENEDSGTARFGVEVNGKPAEKTVRYSLLERGEDFKLERDLPRLHDGFAEDPLLRPDLPVTRLTYVIGGVDPEEHPAASAFFRLPADMDDTVVYFPEMSGFDTTQDGSTRLSAWTGRETVTYEICLLGEAAFEPEWAVYQTGAGREGQEIGVEVRKTDEEKMTLLEFALGGRPEGSPVSDADWYNAVIAEIRKEAAGNGGRNAVSLDGYQDQYRGLLMQWFDYEIELGPGERILNEVTAPLYPSVDTGYTPSIFRYTYLLSPAKTWTEFGPVDITIRTPYYLTDSSLDGFEKIEGGYYLRTGGLPEKELEFTLSSSEKPEKPSSPLLDFACGLLGL